MATSQKSTQTNSQTSTASLAAFLAKHLVSQESEKDLKTPEERSSLTLREYCEQNNLDYSSLKMLKDFSATMVGELSKPSSKRLMNWGTTANGKCLTAKISASRKTGKGSTLSDILEERPDPKYFLSEEQVRRIHSTDGISPTIPTAQGGGVMPKIIDDTQGFDGIRQFDIAPTMRSQRSGLKVYTPDHTDVRIRRLTPLETERLQGFPDNWTAQGTDGAISDTQRYKMCGNAVTTNVVQAVFERIFESTMEAQPIKRYYSNE